MSLSSLDIWSVKCHCAGLVVFAVVWPVWERDTSYAVWDKFISPYASMSIAHGTISHAHPTRGRCQIWSPSSSLSLSHPFIILTKVTKSTTTHNSSPGRRRWRRREENLEGESALSRLAVIHCCLIFPLLDRTIGRSPQTEIETENFWFSCCVVYREGILFRELVSKCP